MKASINGQQYRFEDGISVLDACRSAGIRIPTLCHDTRLKPIGSCRMCLVEIEGKSRPVAACNTQLTEVHDSPIVGPKTQPERIEVLQNIFTDQRSLLAKHVNQDVSKVPQIFCPYKEVLADYRSGLKVPDDITIVFPDDNFGYIRYFPNAEERKRAGGSLARHALSTYSTPDAHLRPGRRAQVIIGSSSTKLAAS